MPSLNALNVQIRRVGKDWIAHYIDGGLNRNDSNPEGAASSLSMAVIEALTQFSVECRGNIYSVLLPPGDEGQSLFRFYQFLSRLSPNLNKPSSAGIT